ncbi:hypothetical protein HOLleu_25874 [Holothuria leucospilota]|uniref:Uncharacterized protein n=1 Tax=Holothuria leucospilota TaxID=206669 RepID=A0A9Q1BTG0_HOLLE|nr:hypothetical protein HOLleu_25874 [Holothuria leucospilota]
MAQSLGSKLWGPFKELYSVVDGAVSKKNPDAFNDLEAALRKHKPDFVSLLQNPAKNAQHREQLKKANTEGIVLDGQTGQQTLPVEVIEEALIISDLFDLNEYTSVELLLAGEQEQPRFPGYSRGLVSVLLYYDGRASLLNSLQLLIQVSESQETLSLSLLSLIDKCVFCLFLYCCITGSKLWGPFKELYSVVDGAVSKKNPDAFNDLEAALRKHKPDFVSLLQNPAKNAQHREQLKKANTEGIVLDGQTGQQTLPVEVIEEALIISDLFDLNEYTSVELLLAGEQEQPRFPGYSRGLVSVLLYYDGRASLLNSLQLLIQARKGRTWAFEIEEEVTDLATEFTDELMKDGLTKKILTLLEKLVVVDEIDRLIIVTQFLNGIRTSLAESLFAWSCQTPLGCEDLKLLFNHLQKHASLDQGGCLDEVTIALTMAFLYSIDISNLEPRDEDRDESARQLPLLQDTERYLNEIHTLVAKEPDATDSAVWKGLKAVLEFGMGITLRRATQLPETQGR